MPAPASVILDTQASPAAALRPLPVGSVTLADSFWEPRRRLNRDVTLPSQFAHLEETGAIDNFRRAAGRKEGAFQGMWFSDSDVYKWLEAASWALAAGENPPLAALVDTAIEEIAAAQDQSGYLNTYFTFERVPERWTTLNFDFNNMHELYCAGHLFQAAVAHFRATGQTTLLGVAERFAGHICDTFGPGQHPRQGVDGHPEIEMALAELFRATGERRFLDQARYFLDARVGMGRMNGAQYPFLPFRDYRRMEGHAVCGVYLASGAADIYAETGDPALKTALDALWDNMTDAQQYVTGGIGPRWDNEAFGADYELPARAYAETCASIGNLMWNARMLTLRPDAKYADLMERVLYNGFLSGVSLAGTEYFYQNPLADDGRHRREAWFGCACCPPNVARLLAQLPGYFYSAGPEGLYVHLYAEGRADLTLPDGQGVMLTQTTNYPWEGRIQITVETGGCFALHLRVPAWADGAALSVNGRALPAPMPGSYAPIAADWNPGDVVTLDLPLAPRLATGHPRCSEQTGRAALLRGPLVYCFEQEDNAADIRDIRLPTASGLRAVYDPDLLGGTVALEGASASGEPVTAIPYYAWANRTACPMTVWVRQ